MRPGAVRTEPLVSVIITSYNYRRYIGETIDSVVASTHANLEVVVVDNRSTDGTVPYLRERYAADPRVKIYENERNIGQKANAVRGFELSTAPFVMWLSADDWIAPGFLERVLAPFAREPAIDVVYAGAYFADDTSRVFAMRQEDVRFPLAYTDAREELIDMLTINCPLCWHAALFRRSVFLDVGLEDPEDRIDATDWELQIRIALAGKRFAYFPEPMVFSRVHDAQVNTSGPAAIGRPLRDFLDILDKFAAHPELRRMRGREAAVAAFLDGMVVHADAQGVPDAVGPELRERARTAVAELRARAAEYEPARVRASLVSVILPVARSPRLTARAIASVLAQTATAWEIVLVDHGEMSFGDWLDTQPGRERIVYLRSPAPLTAGRARAIALRAARGEYLAFLDEDNTFAPDHLATLVDTVARSGGAAAAASARLVLEHADPYYRSIRELDVLDVFRRPADPPALSLAAAALPLDALLVYRRVQDSGARFNEGAPILDDYAFALAVERIEGLVFSGRTTVDVRARIDFRSALGAQLPQYVPVLDAVYAAFPAEPEVQALRARHRAAVDGAIRTLTSGNGVTMQGAGEALAVLAGRGLVASERL